MKILLLETYRTLFGPISYFDIALWITVIFTSFFIIFYTLHKFDLKSKQMSKLQKLNILTWIIFFFLIGITGVLNLIWRYLITEDTLRDFLDDLTYFLCELAFLSKILFTEYSINQYKFYKGYYFSIFFFLLIPLTTIILPEPVGEIGIIDILYIVLFSTGVMLFPVIFLYIAFKLEGEERRMALKITIGYIFLIIGILFQPQNLTILKPFISNFELFSDVFLILCPFLLLCGILIMFSSYHKTLHPDLN